MTKALIFALAVFLVLAMGGEALARKTGDFSKGRWVAYAQAGFMADSGNEVSGTYQAAMGAGYHFRDGLSANLEVPGYYFDQDDDAPGAGLNLCLRWHFVESSPWTAYLEAGAGLLFTTKKIPERGNHENYTQFAGLGLTRALADRLHLMLAARYQHVSNSRTGHDHNPGLDNFGGYIGLALGF